MADDVPEVNMKSTCKLTVSRPAHGITRGHRKVCALNNAKMCGAQKRTESKGYPTGW